MAQKLIIFSDCCWIRPQYRSKNRRVPGNISLAHHCLAPKDDLDVPQIPYFREPPQKLFSAAGLMRRYFGLGLQAEVFDIYRFLSITYQQGDEIYLLGSGLGAYNLRRLADMIDRVGLLEPDDLHMLPEIFEYYQIPVDALSTPAAMEMKEKFNGRPVRIRFLGCWDTVGSHGLPLPLFQQISQSWMMLHDHDVNANVDAAFQALALDERRKLFQPALWTGAHSSRLEKIEQVWFAGSHENIVGGRRDSGLSDIALIWLLNRAQEHGLSFDPEKLAEISAPDIAGSIARKRRFIYGKPISIGRPYNRPVDRTKGEKLHESVLQKQQAEGKYLPPQLASLRPGDIPVFKELNEPIANKRRHLRRKVDWPAFLINGDVKLNASLVDYSKSGAKVWLHGQIPVGTSIILQSSRSFMEGLKSKVIWSQDNFIGLEFAAPLVANNAV